MMQRWTMVALLGATAAGCVAPSAPEPTTSSDRGPDSSQVSQDVLVDTCHEYNTDAYSQKVPAWVDYGGEELPGDGPYIVMVGFFSTDGYTEIGRVDTKNKIVTNIWHVKQDKLPSFMALLGRGKYAQAVFGGHPNPPPPVIDGIRWLVTGDTAINGAIDVNSIVGKAEGLK